MAVTALAVGFTAGNANAITATTLYGKDRYAISHERSRFGFAKDFSGTHRFSTLAITGADTVRDIVIDEIRQVPAVPDPLDAWLEKLIKQESHGRWYIRVLDNNGYYSYGCLQFQMSTFKAYGNMYDLLPQNMNDTGYLSKIYDCELQKKLARRMIQDEYDNWQHWMTSVLNTVGFPPKATKKHELSLKK